MSVLTEDIKAKAEIYRGNDLCKEKSMELLKDIGLPNGLLPLQDMEECGIVRETGHVWLKQKKKITHKFEKINRLVAYDQEITAIAESGKIKNLKGVKSKELLLWVALTEISVDNPPTGKITFKTPSGLYRTFPTSAFEVEELKIKEVPVNGAEEEVEVKEV